MVFSRSKKSEAIRGACGQEPRVEGKETNLGYAGIETVEKEGKSIALTKRGGRFSPQANAKAIGIKVPEIRARNGRGKGARLLMRAPAQDLTDNQQEKD